MNNIIIKSKINHCVDRIYNEDGDLFQRNNYEVTISSKLAQYLFLEFPKYDVDCEYNKHINGIKEADINGELREIRPDILIHRRGTDKDNLVAIEIKKEQNSASRDPDYSKLKSLTLETKDYKYKLGVFIDFAQDYSTKKIKFFENGRESQ